MRLQRYKDLGAKRSLRAVVASEPQDEKATKGNKNQAKKSDGGKLSNRLRLSRPFQAVWFVW